ncbi:hypothetical protein ACET3Z_032256 [Daucus carota]
MLDAAVKTYQANYNLKITGILDSETISKMAMPRCGFPDIINGTNSMTKKNQEHQHPGAHGDNSPFDGPGGILAHGFFPTDGRLHFDADESFSIGAIPNYIDLESVAVHEIGHLLGLAHSTVQDAIMYPTLLYGVVKTNLQPDDIQGIKALYNI